MASTVSFPPQKFEIGIKRSFCRAFKPTVLFQDFKKAKLPSVPKHLLSIEKSQLRKGDNTDEKPPIFKFNEYKLIPTGKNSENSDINQITIPKFLYLPNDQGNVQSSRSKYEHELLLPTKYPFNCLSLEHLDGMKQFIFRS